MSKPELRRGARVVIVNPRKFYGGTGGWLGRKARVKYVSKAKRYVTLVFDGETDEIWFFTDELEVVG